MNQVTFVDESFFKGERMKGYKNKVKINLKGLLKYNIMSLIE